MERNPRQPENRKFNCYRQKASRYREAFFLGPSISNRCLRIADERGDVTPRTVPRTLRWRHRDQSDGLPHAFNFIRLGQADHRAHVMAGRVVGRLRGGGDQDDRNMLQAWRPFNHRAKIVARNVRALCFRGCDYDVGSFGLDDFQRLARLLHRDHLIAVFLQEFLHRPAHAHIHDSTTSTRT